MTIQKRHDGRTVRQSVRPHALIDEIRREFGIKTDTALSEHLGILNTHVSKVRAGRLNVTSEFMLAIHEATDWPFTKIRELAAKSPQADQLSVAAATKPNRILRKPAQV